MDWDAIGEYGEVLRIVLVVLLIVAAVYPVLSSIRRRYESKRSEAVQTVAHSLGMSFEDGRDIDAMKRFGPFCLFSEGDEKKVRNCMSGAIDGVDVTTFEYEYTLRGSEGSSTLRQTVAVFRSNKLSLPVFELRPRPRTIVRSPKFVRALLFGKDKDIKFDTHPAFSKSYVLLGKDESVIRHIFSHSVLEYFASHKGLSVEGKGLSVEGIDEQLLYYSHERSVDYSWPAYRGARVKPDEIKLFLDEGKAVFDLFLVKP